MMKFHLFTYQCAECKKRFKAPELLNNEYGEFLLRSLGSGSEAFLNAIDDTVYQEVDDILHNIEKLNDKTDLEMSDVLQDIFGVVCDFDIDGTEYKINMTPKCPYCGSRNMIYWEATEPVETVEKEIPAISHNKWISLSAGEKRKIIFEKISNK